MDLRDQIIDKVSITEIYPKSLNRQKRGHCCTHDNTDSPSFTYYPHTSSWYCWSCKKGGSVIDLYSHVNNLSYKDSLYELAESYKIDISPEELKIIEKKSSIYEIFDFFCDICHKNLLKSEYLEDVKERRGFNDEIISEFRIGIFDDSIKEEMEKNVEQQNLFDAGFLNENLHWYIGKRIVYPYLNMRKEPVYFIYRLIDSEPDFRKDAKYIKHRKEYIQENLFGLNSLNKFNKDVLIITEGITDAISVIMCEYPCLSPVTTRFKEDDNKKIVKYSQRFEKVVIINDNEENGQGLEGAKTTLKHLIKNQVKGYIVEIPRLENVSKIDLDEYLKTDGVNKLNELTDQSFEGFEYLLSFINDKSTTDDIGNVLVLLSEKDIKRKSDTINKLNRKIGIGKRDLNTIYKDFKLHEKEESEKSNIKDDLFSGEVIRERDDLIFSFEFENITVENRKDGVFYPIMTEEGFIEKQVLPFPLIMIHKTRSFNIDLFSYSFDDKIFNTQSRADILSSLETYRTGGDRGRDVLKMLITEMAKELKYKTLESVLGFNNKWVLPQLQEKNEYRILITTDFQRRVYKNSQNLISDDYDIDDIKDKLINFLDNTDMNDGKVAIIIGWSIAQLFRLSFIEYFYFVPDLLLIGDPQTGKTAFSKVVVTDFYKAWKKPLQGAQIATKSSFEDACSTSTFPILVDELEYLDYKVVDPMKARATDIPDFSRKTSSKEMFVKPEVAGFCITTNTVPKAFYNSALIERFVVLNYSSKEVIMEKQEWNDIARDLKKLDLFSPIYELTKDWNNEEVFNKIKSIQKYCPLFSFDARLRKKYIFIFFGLALFNRVFGIDLTKDLEILLFEQSGRIITGDLLNDFVNFCNIAINYDHGSTSQAGTAIKGNNPKFITRSLEMNKKGDYIFIPQNLRDFKEFTGDKKYNMRGLCAQLNKSVGKKDYFFYGSHSLEGGRYTSIKIPESFNKDINIFKKNDL